MGRLEREKIQAQKALLRKARAVLTGAAESLSIANDMFEEQEGEDEESQMNESQLVDIHRVIAELDEELGSEEL